MSEYDDILTGQEEKKPSEKVAEKNKPFDSAKWAAEKQQNRKAAYELIDSTAEQIGRDSNRFRAYLDVVSRFDRYSVGNTLLVAAQKPGAVQLRDYEGWKEAGTPVKKGESGIMILEPGDKYTREDGSVGVSMNVKRVFDVTQTSAKPQQAVTKPDDRLLLKALVSKSPVKIEPVDQLNDPSMNALYEHDRQTVYVQRGLDAPELFKAVAKELALCEFATKVPEYSRRKEHFKAQCVAYVIAGKYGIDTKGMEIRVPASYSGMTAQDVRGELTEIRDTACDMISKMSAMLEQNKNSRNKEQER